MTQTGEIEKSEAFVAYLDILGFTNIAQSENWADSVGRIMAVVREAVSEAVDWEPALAKIPKKRPTTLIVSDSIIIWINPDTDGDDFISKTSALRYLLHIVEEIQYRCAVKDIWIRGGVSFGIVLSSATNIAGPGYLNAYRLEATAEFPRVLVDASMMKSIFGESPLWRQIQFINKVESEGFSQNALYEFQEKHRPKTHFKPDYPFFVHYLNRLSKDFTRADFMEIWKHLGKNIYSRDPRVFQKHSWVAEYLEHYGEQLDSTKGFLNHIRQNPL